MGITLVLPKELLARLEELVRTEAKTIEELIAERLYGHVGISP